MDARATIKVIRSRHVPPGTAYLINSNLINGPTLVQWRPTVGQPAYARYL